MESKRNETPQGFFMGQKTSIGPEQHLGVPTSVASLTPSLHYKFPNISKPLGVNLEQKFRRRNAL